MQSIILLCEILINMILNGMKLVFFVAVNMTVFLFSLVTKIVDKLDIRKKFLRSDKVTGIDCQGRRVSHLRWMCLEKDWIWHWVPWFS